MNLKQNGYMNFIHTPALVQFFRVELCQTLYFDGPPTDILLIISNFATACQLILPTRTLKPKPNPNLTVC